MSLLLLIPAFIALFVALSAICYEGIKKRAEPFIYNSTTSLPKVEVAIVLGTAKLVSSGDDNIYYQYRIAAAAELYKAGLIKKFIVSGAKDETHNQPAEMKASMIEKGIPEKIIIIDPFGFRTYDSVWRCRYHFQQKKAIVVSQEFHNERAIFLGQFMDIQLYGYNARRVGGKSGFKIMLREWLARQKCLWDVFLLSVKRISDSRNK